VKAKEFRQMVEAIQWEEEMTFRSQRAGLCNDESSPRDGTIDGETDMLDFVHADSWLTDVTVGIFDEQESCNRSYKKRFQSRVSVMVGQRVPRHRSRRPQVC